MQVLHNIENIRKNIKKKDKNLWNKISDNRKILLQFILTNLFYFLKIGPLNSQIVKKKIKITHINTLKKDEKLK